MNYNFKIDQFYGPLDLLLHLVQKKERNIFDINVKTLANQYLAFIKSQQDLKLEISSEYLVMASYLVELKSKALIPLEQINIEGDYRQSEKYKLIQKLIEYKKYKSSVMYFKKQFEKRLEQFDIEPHDLSHLEVPINKRDVNVSDAKNVLSKALEKMFKRLILQTPLNTTVAVKPINMKKLESTIINLVVQKNKIKMSDIFALRKERNFIIAVLICVLDLAKNNFVNIFQDKEFSNIMIERKL